MKNKTKSPQTILGMVTGLVVGTFLVLLMLALLSPASLHTFILVLRNEF